MEKKFENNDFEHFVKQNADQYRMFPSEKVWKGINNTLHTRRRWYGVGLALLLLSTAAVTGIMLSPSSSKQSLTSSEFKNVSSKTKQVEKSQPSILITPSKSLNNKNISIISPDNTQKNLFTSTNVEIIEVDKKTNTSLSEEPTQTNNLKPIETEIFVFKTPTITKQQIISKPIINSIKTNPQPVSIINTSIIDNHHLPEANEIAANEKEAETIDNTTQESSIYPMSIESVFNTYIKLKPSKKITWQVYVTPSITYRKLDENKPFLDAARSSLPTINTTGVTPFYSFADINRLVTHKPDIGLQLGISAGYPFSKVITLKAGLQFNVSKYNIMATSHTNEVALVALSNPNGGRNTISTVSNLRNVGGYKSSWLHNKYISASIPLGVEIKLSKTKKTVIGVAGSIEPTYVLGNRAYILSTDLKNYAEIPSLTRKWNINSGFEIFAGYNTGKIDWRIGPQVRYQIFSSFNNSYPIKENLFDFGVKIGVTLK